MSIDECAYEFQAARYDFSIFKFHQIAQIDPIVWHQFMKTLYGMICNLLGPFSSFCHLDAQLFADLTVDFFDFFNIILQFLSRLLFLGKLVFKMRYVALAH